MVNGDTIDFKINTDAADYEIDIYPTSWYQGLGARHIVIAHGRSPRPPLSPRRLLHRPSYSNDDSSGSSRPGGRQHTAPFHRQITGPQSGNPA